MKLYGLIGHPLGHSFSQAYFNEKFEKEHLDCRYENYDLEDIGSIRQLISEHNDLKGFNVTIPYKEAIIPYLDEMDEIAKEVKAVNTVKVLKNGKLKGYNTDVLGFKLLLPHSSLLTPHPSLLTPHSSLILGTGGASKAVQYALRKQGIKYRLVSRSPQKGDYVYDALTDDIVKAHTLIINATPVGTFPNVDDAPMIPYEAITPNHMLIDLIYNPEETLFLKKGKAQGAKVMNGMRMLVGQAEASWKIWKN